MNTRRPANTKFDSLYEQFQVKTRQIMAKVLRNGDLVDDCQQILWTAVWRRLQAGEPIGNAGSYLAQAAHTEALRLRRDMAAAKNQAVSLDELIDSEHEDGGSSFQIAEEEDAPSVPEGLRNALRVAVDRLPAKVQEVVSRHYFGGQPVSQIARELGIAQSTVTSHLVHGREALRKLFTRKAA